MVTVCHDSTTGDQQPDILSKTLDYVDVFFVKGAYNLKGLQHEMIFHTNQ